MQTPQSKFFIAYIAALFRCLLNIQLNNHICNKRSKHAKAVFLVYLSINNKKSFFLKSIKLNK